jgi:molybdenum cofactor guanylyltransferase
VPDTVEGFAGPLAGVLAGLDWTAMNVPSCRWVASVPTDAPFLPRDLVARLLRPCLRGDADMSCATSAGQVHPVVGLWPVSARADLRHALIDEKIHKVDLWTARYRLAPVEFSAEPVDPFFNANRPEDLAEAERLVSLAR